MLLKLLESENKYLFVTSSAVHTRFGVYDSTERVEQAMETYESIRKYCPDSDIAILDSGQETINEETLKKFKEYSECVMDYTQDPQVKEIQKIENWDIVKNCIEVLVFTDYFKKLLAEPQHKKYTRIFKLSSRYKLTEEFDINVHTEAKDKIVIKGPFTSQFPSEVTNGVRLQYMSRLWSFDSNLLSYISDTYERIYANMIERINNRGYIDIEHSLYQFLDAQKVKFATRMGVEGMIAPIGKEVKE